MLSKLTVTRVTLHVGSDSPVFGDSAMHFWLDDEGGGPFVRITGCTDSDPVKFDFNELANIQEAFRILQAAEEHSCTPSWMNTATPDEPRQSD